jgi:putative oxidoreductase
MTASQLMSPSSRPDAGLAILRVVLGIIFVAHGAQKLFVFGLDGVAGGFAQMGAPLPEVTAPLVAFGEFAGGMALTLGLFSRVVSVALAAIMLGALLIVHLPNGFFMPAGIEFVLALMAGAIALAITGPGSYSLDAAILRRQASR